MADGAASGSSTSGNNGPGRRFPAKTVPDKLDLTGLAPALDTALERERPIVVAATDADGNPQVSFRGSTTVYSPEQIAIWVRKAGDGLATYITQNPTVALLYYDPDQGPDPAVSPRRVAIRGRARVEPSLNDAVWEIIPEVERERAKDRSKGVAVIVDVDSVDGFGGAGPIKQAR